MFSENPLAPDRDNRRAAGRLGRRLRVFVHFLNLAFLNLAFMYS